MSLRNEEPVEYACIGKFLIPHGCENDIFQVLILGDFNCDMLPKRLASDAKDLRDLFNLYQFNQLIQSPTRITDRIATLIDLAFTTEKEKIVSYGVLDCAMSDHSLVFIIRRAKKPRAAEKL